MLENLIIENFAIIDQVDLTFEEGMSVLTGETGAGKSIIIDALAMLAGARANSTMIRRGAEKATLQAVFSYQADGELAHFLAEEDLLGDDHEVIIYREFNQKGRNNIRVNGTLVNLKTLSTLGTYLVDIQGQHDTQLLLNDQKHLPLLDSFAGQALTKVKQAYQGLYQDFRKVTQQIKSLESNQAEISQRLDLLKFQQEELATANLQAGEEDELLAQRNRLQNFKKISDSLESADRALNGEVGDGVLDRLAEIRQNLQEAASYDEAYQNLSQTISDAYYSAQEASRDLDERLSSLSFDEQELIKIDDRLQEIHRLERKYGATVDDVLAFQAKVEKDLSSMGADDLDLTQLEAKRQTLRAEIAKQADALHAVRAKAAEALEKDVNQQLADLLMPEARFEVRFERIEGYLPTGNDRIAFYVQTNRGEGMAPLVKIPSGGEAARLMLALKTVFIHQQEVATVVFDEIDTGVSGRVARAIALKMKAIAQKVQVLAITHLPQVAAAADHHYFIEKSIHDDRTVTSVQALDEAGRLDALARMLSGNEITEAALANARELRKNQ
ncbi:DNA repair protein RecN [Eupransor demetentiae]|uniref:DNA repair protein RecN n=1 Tax=Eupransor demetentiae TaxID=3109584 RepID=A0ABM9N3B7_9LACO|nr:DNA repair ATPase RecN (RecN) [Lactobacillaceae bacterium LMG 33000]